MLQKNQDTEMVLLLQCIVIITHSRTLSDFDIHEKCITVSTISKILIIQHYLDEHIFRREPGKVINAACSTLLCFILDAYSYCKMGITCLF